MYTKQVSVFMENRKGRLAEVTRLLSDEGINIRAMALADMPDVGVLRLIVSDRDRCLRVLRDRGFVAQETDVIAVEIPDRPGGLHRVIDAIDRADLSIEYMYSFFRKDSDVAIGVFKIDEAVRAVETLAANGIAVLSGDAVEKL